MRKIILLAALVLGGCTVGPDYHAPQIAMPAAYRAASPNIAMPETGDLSQWWQRLNDPELNSLIGRALKSNPDLLAASSRVRESREQIIIAGAAGLPQIGASGLAAHLHSNSSLASKLGMPSGGGPPPSGSTDIKLYSLGFDATWEADIFGGVRRAVEAAQAGSDAALWQMRDGEVTLTAEIAVDYFTLRFTQARIALLGEEVGAQKGVLALTAARERAGFVTQLDVNQQNALVATSEAQIPPLRAQARAMEHAIAVLLGAQPETLIGELDASSAPPIIPATLPAGLPSELLRRRPDVRAGERNLAAATAQIGVATADLYPKFNLIGAASYSSNSLGNLISGNNLATIALGSILWPIFNGGKTHANIRAKQEEAQQAYYAYQKSVLGAVQNVEDALARYAADRESLAALERAQASASSSAAIAAQQYRAGLATYVNVYTAQANELSTRDQLAQTRQALTADMVSLFKALGGGWQEND